MSWMNEYPRPQLRRESFLCLNGPWQVNGQTIEVPFPPQSRLSGWQGSVPETLHYARAFQLPEDWLKSGQRVRLHFGAVDCIADVYVNGAKAAHHEGGYLAFSADVTDSLRPGENELRVDVTDTTSRRWPLGKQSRKPHGMWYTPVSGIWQTVWMECVPERCIEGLRITPDLTGVTLEIQASQPVCTVSIAGMEAQTIPTNEPVRLEIAQPHLWTTEDPFLYGMVLQAEEDVVASYFALRTVSVEERSGRARILLNGAPVFLNGVLDQGYFSDGLYLPAAPEEYMADIFRMKAMGFNLLRKHIKVEPEVFYHACDRLGMLVMQDMVNNGPYHYIPDTVLPTIGLQRRPDRFPWGKKRKAIFRQHSLDTVAQVYNHPSVIAYTLFNEGWGQFSADAMYRVMKQADATRLWDATSGWFAQHESDFESLHVYFRNKQLKAKGNRPLLLSECGGYARPVAGHLFKEDASYGYGVTATEAELTAKIEQMYEEMVLPSIPEGLCGVVYTQLSDVEEEINGLYTYDRQVCKASAEALQALAERAQETLEAAVQAKDAAQA